MPTQPTNNILQQRAYAKLKHAVTYGYPLSVAAGLSSGTIIDKEILQLAITKKHKKIIEMLLINIKTNENITVTDKRALYEAAINIATKTQDQQIIKLVNDIIQWTRTQLLHEIITVKQNTAASKDDRWRIMRAQQVLHQAIIDNDINQIEGALKKKIPIDTTALRIAVTNGNQTIVAMLLNNIQNADPTKISPEIKQKLYTYAAQVAINNHDIATLGIILQFKHRLKINLTPILLNIIDSWDITTITAFLNDKEHFDIDIRKQLLYMLTYKFLAKNNKKYSELLTKLLNDIEDISLKAHVLDLAKANNNPPNPTYDQIIKVFSGHINSGQPNKLHHRISLGTEFSEQLVQNLLIHFRDYTSFESIKDPVCFINSETTDDVIMDNSTADTLFENARKESTQNMKQLNDLAKLLNSNAVGDINNGLRFLQSNPPLQKLIKDRGALLLGNSSIDDILNSDLENLKDLFDNLGLTDNWVALHYHDRNTQNWHILSVLNILIEQVKGITSKLGEQALDQNRTPIQLTNKRPARVFMDVYLLAMDIFRTKQQEQYNKWLAQQDDKQELEAAIKELTELKDGRVSSRYQQATYALQVCTKHYEKELRSGKPITTIEELEQLIEDSGLTYNQLKRLKDWGIIKMTIPNKAELNTVSRHSVSPATFVFRAPPVSSPHSPRQRRRH